MSSKPIYLDYAATTPVDPRVLKAMLPYMSEEFGNPGSLHSYGQKASAAVFKARQEIAATIGVHYSEIIFTSSATEANNLAIRGAITYFKKKNPGIRPRILIPAIEHDCVLATAKGATELGTEVIYLPVTNGGFVEPREVKKHLNDRTVLVSVMYANNEVGTIQPVAEIAKVIAEFRGSRSWPLLHSDAVQAFEYLDCDVSTLSVDMMTLSAHKMYGPKGVGCLYVKNRSLSSRKSFRSSEEKYLVSSIILGGGQEEGMRSGTENVPAIVGFAVAAGLAATTRRKEAVRLKTLRDGLLSKLRDIYPKLQVNGDLKKRLPNHLNVYIPGKTAEQMLTELDLMGITISSGSACSARTPEASKVLLAMGADKERATNSLRITLGRQTTAADCAAFVHALAKLKK